MVDKEGEGINKIPSKAVLEFSAFFRGAANANIARSMRYWRERANIISSYNPKGKGDNNLYMSRKTSFGLTLRISKTAKGRGRKRAAWVTALHDGLLSGKLLPSKGKQELIEREVAYHLVNLKRSFDDGIYLEDNVFNADETHFVVDLHDCRTLAMKGDTEVKFADVVSGDVGMTMMIMLGGGSRARLEIPFMIFQNERCSYPIQGVPDNVTGVCYRSGPKGWMDSRVFAE